MRLGAAVERADNTARILDVKYHLLLPENEPVGGGLDYFQWSTILREVSALTAYRWILSGEHQALAGGRSSDPQPPDAALSFELLRRYRPSPRPSGERLRPARSRPAHGHGVGRAFGWATNRANLPVGAARVHNPLHRGECAPVLRHRRAVSALIGSISADMRIRIDYDTRYAYDAPARTIGQVSARHAAQQRQPVCGELAGRSRHRRSRARFRRRVRQPDPRLLHHMAP